MKYPCLVDKRFCRTNIHVTIYTEGLTEDGAPIVVYDNDLVCNYQDSAKTIFTSEQKLVQLTGVALFPGDIFAKSSVISDGTITLFGTTRKIQQGTKVRNPDGTVNYTKLEVI